MADLGFIESPVVSSSEEDSDGPEPVINHPFSDSDADNDEGEEDENEGGLPESLAEILRSKTNSAPSFFASMGQSSSPPSSVVASPSSVPTLNIMAPNISKASVTLNIQKSVALPLPPQP